MLGVEAAHSSLVRTWLYLARRQRTLCDPSLTVADAAMRFAILRGKVGAGVGQGVTARYNGTIGANLVADDQQGLAYARNHRQVGPVISSSWQHTVSLFISES